MKKGISCPPKLNSYFCQMHLFPRFLPVACLFLMLTGLTSCEGLWKKDTDRQPVARVGDQYLYQEDLDMMLPEITNPEDSASFVNNYITTWATRQLLLDKARINLTEEQLQRFEALVSNYRTDLYTRAYKEALVQQKGDTSISREQLMEFYEREKQNFLLKEKLVRLRYAELPQQFLNRDQVVSSLRDFNEDDQRFLDSIGVQFRKIHLNDSLWVPLSRVISEIPPITIENESRYLKNSQFFELEDSTGVYLGKVIDTRNPNEIAPLSYIEPTIRHVLLNRRKLDYLKQLELELIDEATKENEFEVYE